MKYVILITSFFIAAGASAQPGKIDDTFGTNPWRLTDFFKRNDIIHSIAIQPDGKIIAVGSSILSTDDSKFALARFNADNSLDSSFGRGGKLLLNFFTQSEFGHSVLLQPDGKILVGGLVFDTGWYRFSMARFNKNGSVDSSFGSWGTILSSFRAAYSDKGFFTALQSDGRIVVAGTYTYNNGYYDFIVTRYNSDGTTDSSFGTNGIVLTNLSADRTDFIHALEIQKDGKILVAGQSQSIPQSALLRLNPDGSFDTTFGTRGKALGDDNCTIVGMHILSNGKILLGGWASDYSPVQFVWLRLNSDGSPDVSFSPYAGRIGTYLKTTNVRVNSFITTANNQMILVGDLFVDGTYYSILKEYKENGSLDSSFGYQGTIITDNAGYNTLAAAASFNYNGHIVVGGYSFSGSDNDFAIFTCSGDGKFDKTPQNGKVAKNKKGDNIATSLVIAPYDALIILAGYTTEPDIDTNVVLTSFDKLGMTNRNFEYFNFETASGTGQNFYCNSLVTDPTHGNIYLAGQIYSAKTFTVNFALVRSSFNGKLDSTFAPAGIMTTDFGNGFNYCSSLLLRPDGKIVATGYAFIDRNYDFALARYTKNGNLDSTFGINGKVTTDIGVNQDYAYASALQPDGKIVLCGTTYNDKQWQIALIRYNSNGSLDHSFGSSGIVLTALHDSDDEAKSIAIQSDGKIIIAGYTRNGKNNNFALVRYNTNGNIDTTFGKSGIVETAIGSGNAEANGVVIEKDGKIVAAGYSSNGKDDDFTLACYNSDGSLDKNFGTGGITTTDFGFGDDHGNAVALQSDGAIVVAGYAFNGTDKDYAVARYLPDLNFGIVDRKPLQNISTIYPNPIHNTATLQYELTHAQPITIKLFDVLGNERAVFINNEISSEGKNSEQIIFPNEIGPGVYFLRIEAREGIVSVKVVKE